MQYIRRPAHAGSWYTKEGTELTAEVAKNIVAANAYQQSLPTSTNDGLTPDGADVVGIKSLLEKATRGLIVGLYGPHAGLHYSGNTNSHAYTLVEKVAASNPVAYGSVKRVFLIGPTHHKAMHMEVSGASSYVIPWGKGTVDLPCDAEVLRHVQTRAREAGISCGTMDKATDEAEHSLEMHLPFIARMIQTAFGGLPAGGELAKVKVVPMLFGGLSQADHDAMAASILGPYFAANAGGFVENFFVFSTDFCHWGSRFGYTYHHEPSRYPVIGDSIQAMDLLGVRHLRNGDIDGWEGYLRKTRNTICGRHPISTMLRLAKGGPPSRVVPVHYSQSSKAMDKDDSSVSYASGVLVRDLPDPK